MTRSKTSLRCWSTRPGEPEGRLMGDFYDSDIGLQTADVLILPSSFLKTLWKELTDGFGEAEAPGAFFRCGESIGVNLAANYYEDTGQIDALLNRV